MKLCDTVENESDLLKVLIKQKANLIDRIYDTLKSHDDLRSEFHNVRRENLSKFVILNFGKRDNFGFMYIGKIRNKVQVCMCQSIIKYGNDCHPTDASIVRMLKESNSFVYEEIFNS